MPERNLVLFLNDMFKSIQKIQRYTEGKTFLFEQVETILKDLKKQA